MRMKGTLKSHDILSVLLFLATQKVKSNSLRFKKKFIRAHQDLNPG